MSFGITELNNIKCNWTHLIIAGELLESFYLISFIVSFHFTCFFYKETLIILALRVRLMHHNLVAGWTRWLPQPTKCRISDAMWFLSWYSLILLIHWPWEVSIMRKVHLPVGCHAIKKHKLVNVERSYKRTSGLHEKRDVPEQ